ncbi:MAG: energy transducer TonB [Gammaproteobacteria bacterium]|nr:energy transducer TonB [Gammaproteobacteria bacterium]
MKSLSLIKVASFAGALLLAASVHANDEALPPELIRELGTVQMQIDQGKRLEARIRLLALLESPLTKADAAQATVLNHLGNLAVKQNDNATALDYFAQIQVLPNAPDALKNLAANMIKQINAGVAQQNSLNIPKPPAPNVLQVPEHRAVTPKPINRVDPIFPVTALAQGAKGVVKLGFDLDREGKPYNIVVIESKPEGVFNNAAIEAMKQWRFEPHTRDGIVTPLTNVQWQFQFNSATESIPAPITK